MSSFSLIEVTFESKIDLINVTFADNIGPTIYSKSSSGFAKDIKFDR
jgi:hypothetical protein